MDIPGRERVPGATSPQQDCSLEEIMTDDAAAWNSLTRGLCVGEEVIVGGETLSKQACCIHALELDPHNSAVWHALAEPSRRVTPEGSLLVSSATRGRHVTYAPWS